jgi:hypothetical protein
MPPACPISSHVTPQFTIHTSHFLTLTLIRLMLQVILSTYLLTPPLIHRPYSILKMKTIYLISLLLHESTAFLPNQPQRAVVQKSTRCNALKSQDNIMLDDGNIGRRSFLSSSAIIFASSTTLLTGDPSSAFADDNQAAAAIYAYRSGGLPSLVRSD